MSNYSSSVGLSKAGGDFAVGRKQAKELKKKRKSKKSKLSLKQKILKALKITAKGAAKGAGGAVAVASELAVPDQAGAPTLPKGFYSWSPRKKSQYVNSLQRK